MGKVRRKAGKKKRSAWSGYAGGVAPSFVTSLRIGDTVQCLGGGNSAKERALRGKVGKILRFLPKRQRVVVEGVNMVKRHQRARTSAEVSGIIDREGSIHISNVQYYSQEFKRPFRIVMKRLDDGRKVRGIKHPETKEFRQIDA